MVHPPCDRICFYPSHPPQWKSMVWENWLSHWWPNHTLDSIELHDTSIIYRANWHKTWVHFPNTSINFNQTLYKSYTHQHCLSNKENHSQWEIDEIQYYYNVDHKTIQDETIPTEFVHKVETPISDFIKSYNDKFFLRVGLNY